MALRQVNLAIVMGLVVALPGAVAQESKKAARRGAESAADALDRPVGVAEPPPPVRVVPPGEAIPEPTPKAARLFLVVRADPFMDPRELKAKILKAVRKVDPTSVADIEVTPINKATHDALEALIRRGPIPGQPQAGEIIVTPHTGESSLWEVSTGDPDIRLVKLEITYTGSDDKDVTASYDVAPKTKTEAPLRYYQPGLYLLRLDTDAPKSCVVTLQNTGGTPRQVSMTWPQTDRYFIVALVNFSIDRAKWSRLDEALKDKNVVSPPFKDIGQIEPMSLVLANLKEVAAVVSTSWKGNIFEVGMPAPENTSTQRIWILFPLSSDQKVEELRKFTQVVRSESYLGVPRYIRTRSELATDRPYPLSPETPPKWYELPGKEGDRLYSGRFGLQQIDAWKARPPQECWWLVVYENGDGSDASPNAVIHPKTGARVFAVDEEVTEWPTGIKKLRQP